MLLLAVVIAGDGARADIGSGADLRVAQIGQMLALGARAEPRILELDEISDARIRFGVRVHAQSRERSDLRARIDVRIRDQRIGGDDDPIGHFGVFKNGARADAAILADAGVGPAGA